MVVLGPCLHRRVSVEGERLGGLPGAVVDAEVDLRFCGLATGFGGVPDRHIGGRADGACRVEDRHDGFGVHLADLLVDVLDNLVHVEDEQDSPARVVGAEDEGGEFDLIGTEEPIDDADQLPDEVGGGTPPLRAHLVEEVPGCLEDDPLEPDPAEFLKVNGGDLVDSGFAVDDRGEFGDPRRLGSIEDEGFCGLDIKGEPWLVGVLDPEHVRPGDLILPAGGE